MATVTFNNRTMNSVLIHQDQLDAPSLANLDAEPNLMAELGINGSAVGVNITLDADDSYYAVSEESGADVFDARVAGNDATITNYASTVRSNATNLSKGLQTTVLELDASGVPTAYNSTPSTAFMYSDTSIPTGFKPNLDVMMIEETVSGELQDFGSDVVLNGTFESPDTDWVLESGWSISDGTANFDAVTNGYITQFGVTTDGVRYLLDFEVLEGVVSLQSHQYGEGDGSYGVGKYSIVVLIIGGRLAFYSNSVYGTGKIDNISLKELTTKTQRTEVRKLTHDEAVLGDNLVINGDFEFNLDGWANNGCTWDASQRCHMVSDGSNILIQQNDILDRTKVNIITLDVEISLGQLDVIATSGTLLSITESGSYTITAPIADITLNDLVLKRGFVTAGIPTDCYIDNISVKEVTTETKYYIDNVLQDVTPPLPTSTTVIDLNDTAVIGYADTITKRHGNFKISSVIN